MKTTSQLTNELNKFCEDHGYHPQSADELRYEIGYEKSLIQNKIDDLQMEQNTMDHHISYLTQFIDDWDNAVENEDNIRKGLE